jgi:hypothetical protein
LTLAACEAAFVSARDVGSNYLIDHAVMENRAANTGLSIHGAVIRRDAGRMGQCVDYCGQRR